MVLGTAPRRVGYKVIRVEFDDNGLVNKHTDFMTGFLSGEQESLVDLLHLLRCQMDHY